MDYLDDQSTGMEGWLEVEPLLNLDMGNYTATASSDDDDDDNGDDGDDIPNPGGKGENRPVESWKPGQQVAALFGQCDWLAAWLGLYLLKPAYVGGYAWAMVGSADEEF